MHAPIARFVVFGRGFEGAWQLPALRQKLQRSQWDPGELSYFGKWDRAAPIGLIKKLGCSHSHCAFVAHGRDYALGLKTAYFANPDWRQLAPVGTSWHPVGTKRKKDFSCQLIQPVSALFSLVGCSFIQSEIHSGREYPPKNGAPPF